MFPISQQPSGVFQEFFSSLPVFFLVQDKESSVSSEEQDAKHLQQVLSCILKIGLFENCHQVVEAIM